MCFIVWSYYSWFYFFLRCLQILGKFSPVLLIQGSASLNCKVEQNIGEYKVQEPDLVLQLNENERTKYWERRTVMKYNKTTAKYNGTMEENFRCIIKWQIRDIWFGYLSSNNAFFHWLQYCVLFCHFCIVVSQSVFSCISYSSAFLIELLSYDTFRFSSLTKTISVIETPD